MLADLEKDGTTGWATAKEHVQSHLRRQILSGRVQGGTRLVQAEIAGSLGVSTTPVREALHDLASEGLVEFGPHRGAVVSELDLNDLHEVFELRKVLEPMVMRLGIPKIDGDGADRLLALCDAMEATSDPPEWVELNREFHGVFMDATGWPRLAGIVGSLHDRASPFVALALRFRPDLFETGNRDHRTLALAASTGDSDAAVRCTVDHMDTTRLASEAQVSPGGSASILNERLP